MNTQVMTMFVFWFLSLLSSVFSYDPSKYNGYKVYQVIPRSLPHILLLKVFEDDDNFDFWTDIRYVNITVDLMVSTLYQNEFESAAKQENIKYSVIIDDVGLILQNKTFTEEVREGGGVTFSDFMRHAEINDYLQQLAMDYPSIVSVESIGKSFEGRNMILIRISSGGSKKPTIYIQAAIHAREWIAPPVALYIINQLVENSNNAHLYEYVDWAIIPIVNPDGYEYTHTHDRFLRKTRSPGPICYGVDANRNFDARWGSEGSSSWPCDYNYHGEEEFSEPETRAVRDYILSHKEYIKLFVDVHSYGRLLLYPYGYSKEDVDNLNELKTLGNLFNNAVYAVNRKKYTVKSFASGLYYASGTSMDWAKDIGIDLAYTVELPKGGNGFDPPASKILSVVKETWEGFKVFHNYVENKFVYK